ncbi:hypothetical protein [Natronolimnobius baerhuensis]|uniref:Uncharacterized protein n=1 Tax=Natronolimnobius baerhuensis TaxID=253108 RepID=A0A202EDR2_9EURY|nr:hypothetical protein [Natronolimnobius baerhuensis]OVE86371.1 hypothetical protein B2G88_06230 [Natronolimnobius baerhuensis]
MQPRTVDPTDARVLERNYDYAQRNARLLSMWYECDLERMIELLAENDVALSSNDERLFGTYYHSVKRRSTV